MILLWLVVVIHVLTCMLLLLLLDKGTAEFDVGRPCNCRRRARRGCKEEQEAIDRGY